MLSVPLLSPHAVNTHTHTQTHTYTDTHAQLGRPVSSAVKSGSHCSLNYWCLSHSDLQALEMPWTAICCRPAEAPATDRTVRQDPQQGKAVLILTRHRDEELDSITVPMETELCLSHGAVGNETAGRFVAVVITIHMDDPTRAAALSRGWWGLVGWGHGGGILSAMALTPVYRRDSIKEKTHEPWRKTFKGAGLFKGLV